MDCNPDSGLKIKDTSCRRNMVILNLNLARVNTEDEAAVATNGTAPAGYFNHGTKLLK